MFKQFKYLFLLINLILLFTPYGASYGQYFLYSDAPLNLEVSFSRHSLEASAKTTFFNALTIRNKSNRSETLTLNFTVPQGWNVIGPEKIELNIAPFDSLIVPLRVSVGSSVRGDIGYSVIASISDSRGNTIKNEYCFVKIPRVSNLTIRFPARMSYLDPTSYTSDLPVNISNKGNRDENVNIVLDGNHTIGIGQRNLSQVSLDLLVPPYTDTTITFPIRLNEQETYGRNMFGVKSFVTTIDTNFIATLWFRKLDSKFDNYIAASDKPLVIELIGRGLLEADRKPGVALKVEGRTLFPGKSEVYYYYQNYSSKSSEDFYKNTRMYVGGVVGPIKLEIGDNYRSLHSNVRGRGAYASYNTPKLFVEALANTNERANVNNQGGAVTYYFQPRNYFKAGTTFSRGGVYNIDSKIGFLGTGFSFNTHRISALASYNLLQREINGQNNHNEFGLELNYLSKVNAFNNSLSLRYGSPFYYGLNSGRLNLVARTRWQVNPKDRLIATYRENWNQRSLFENNFVTMTNKTIARNGTIEYNHIFSPSVQVFTGPGISYLEMSGLQQFIDNQIFSSVNYIINSGLRLQSETGATTISPRVEISRSQIINNPYYENGARSGKWFGYQYFSLNIRSRSFNILSFYTSGPKSVFEQIYYARNSRQNRKLQFMPSFDTYVYKDLVRLYGGLSYTNDLIARSTYSNFTFQLYWYLPKNWTTNILAVYSTQKRETSRDNIESFQNLYLEAGIRKEFDFHQPRVKYYDIKLAFFKDFNGNYIQEPNEPGIKNVLVEISKVGSDVLGDIPGEFYNIELLSDNFGVVHLDRIPEGRYLISYNPIGSETGTFSKAIGDIEIRVDKSGYHYFPFVEKNKVFGKIILNRSRLSGIGNIDLSNVRITATDSHGRSYSTLTDRNGLFILFAPITDEYILSINNIFYENFDLRQNNFLVQFNGYKQFEVNYVFDEKIRRINFAASESELQSGIQQVRRTTISGSVKDANSQQPVRARINLINSRTNAIIVSANSSASNGDYTISFIAGENYVLEVLADDYWYMSENLVLQQVTTFMNINRDVLLKPVTVGSKVELNIRFEANNSFLAPESVAELNRLLRQIRNNPSVRLEIQGHSDDLEALQKPTVSLERANAVAKYLIENGYSNLQVKDMGNTIPVATNDTEEGRFKNRRIDVVVISR
jgi:outer membrane protein OmpA-like peptidoglycan-associated protein